MDNVMRGHLKTLNELQSRFDGPVPKHLLETDESINRRKNGAKALLAEMLEGHRREEERLVSQIDALQIKVCDGTNTPEDDARIDLLRDRLDSTRRNIKHIEGN